jgi:hypothetical protein
MGGWATKPVSQLASDTGFHGIDVWSHEALGCTFGQHSQNVVCSLHTSEARHFTENIAT